MTTSSNITDKDPGQKFHFFITSLFSHNFFYHYHFRETNPLNLQLEKKEEIAVRWWYPDILFGYHEHVTRFELFRRQMRVGYAKFGESLVSAVVIVPSNFNDIERNFDVDAIYGDKIVILTRKLAKLYYIISKVIEAVKDKSIVDNNVIIIFVYEKSITGELYKVGSREFYMLERNETIIPPPLINVNKNDEKVPNTEQEKESSKSDDKTAAATEDLYSTIKTVKERLNKDKEKRAFTVIFRAEADVNKLDLSKLEDCFIVDETKTETELLREGALFKAKTDFQGNSFTFVDNTKKMPHFNIIYPLLNDPSKYRPVMEAFGIDLGTSRSALAIHRFYDDRYDYNVVRDAFDTGTLLYSWVTFDKSEDKPICGRTVYDRFGAKADYIIFDCKKIIGKRYDEIHQSDEWKFELIENGESVKIQVKLNDKDKEGQHLIMVTPEEVYAIMLERFQANAFKTTNVDIKNAVFTVPSNFTQKQKSAMREAAKMAKINVLRFIPEPTAAVLSYCAQMKTKPTNNDLIFVFDLGGGTFDISIFKIEDAKLIELCQHSDLELGGSNFNRLLYNDVVRELQSEHNYEIGEKKYELWIKCTNAKEELTDMEQTNFSIGPNDIDVDITRDKFEQLCKPLIDKIKEAIDLSLKKGNVKAREITQVIKVGGSCEMPMIESLIREAFPNSKLENSDPQHEVVLGAALYASSVLPQTKVRTDFIKNFWPL